MVVFDLDGTLYHQRPIRWRMLAQLLTVPGPGRIARLRDLSRFRRLREEYSERGEGGFDARLFQQTAALTGRPELQLRRLVQEWMEERPLKYLQAARVAGAAELFEALRARGITVAVWSDYPVQAKLSTLGLTADLTLAATDPELDTLKPNPRGLEILLERGGCQPEHALMVGDRMERDGAAAAALGVPFLLRARTGPQDVARVPDFTALVRALRAI